MLYCCYLSIYMLVISMVLWHIQIMVLIMFLLVSDWLMNSWPNRCYDIYCERELDLLEVSQISFRSLCLDMHSWPVDFMFTRCLMEWMSCLDWVRSIPWLSFVLEAFSLCHLSFWKVFSKSRKGSSDKP